MKNICVIFGGVNCEHDISIITAIQTILNMDETKYNIFPIYITKNGKFYFSRAFKKIETFANLNEKTLKTKCVEVSFINGENTLYKKNNNVYKKLVKVDFVIIAMHGLNGEDGCVSGLLNLCNIPYQSCDICASAVCCDKNVFKMLAKGLKLPIVKYKSLTYDDFIGGGEYLYKKIVKQIGENIIVKPNRLGSSIGINKITNFSEYLKYVYEAFKYDDIIILEQYVENFKEVNIAVMRKSDNTILLSSLEQPITNKNILTFEDKYLNNGKVGFAGIDRILNPKFDKTLINKVKKYAIILYKFLKMKGVVRIDYIIDKDNKLFVNEVNTIPGSMAYYLYDIKTFDFKTQINEEIEYGIKEFYNNSKKAKIFSTSVLNKKDLNSIKLKK